jgi:hypothetical protein
MQGPEPDDGVVDPALYEPTKGIDSGQSVGYGTDEFFDTNVEEEPD